MLGKLIGGDRRTDAAPADQNTAFGTRFPQSKSDGLGEVWVIDGRFVVCTQVLDLMTEFDRKGDELA